MRPAASIVITAVLCSTAANAAPALDASDDPHAGIHHEHWTDAAIPARIDLVAIDLTSAEIGVYATTGDARGQTTSGYAASIGAQVAINGDSFAAAGFVPRGLAMGDAGAWSDTHDDAISALLAFGRVQEATVAQIVPPEQVSQPGDLAAETQGVVSGHPMIVRNGAVVGMLDCTDGEAIACQRAPRSAVALTKDGHTMYLAVVDGWQTGSLGMTDAELASFLKARGADSAIALDSGASSTLVLDGSVVNHPSDGVERAVANHLAIKFGSLPKGQLVGFICAHDVFGCDGDSSRWIANAEVTLDDGRQVTTPDGDPPLYDFTSVTPRLACVTVRAAGYLTVTQCETVESGKQTYNSVALFEGTDPPDAGPGLDAATGPDAGSGSGNPDGPDAGTGQPSQPGGCCGVQGGDPSSFLGIVVVGWMLRRRSIRKPA